MYGTLERLDDGRSRLRFTRTLAHPPDKVWRAITEPEHLGHWFPTTIEGERAAGAPLRFSFPGGEAPPFEGEMVVYEPPSVMELRWGADIVRLELRATATGTELTLLDTLEAHGKARESMAAWRDLHPRYVERFGPEAATIGPPEGHPAGS
jgi:uncharacterized protein YndB with AHSA1/START domain